MFDPNYPQGSPMGHGRQPSEPIKNLAMVIALITTVICAPMLTQLTNEWAEQFIISTYGVDAVSFGLFIWDTLIWALVFFTAQAFVVGAVISLLLALSARLPIFAV